MPHDLRDAESVANLDEFPTRDDDLVTRGKLMQRQIDRRGVVVDHNRGMSEQGFEQLPGMYVPLSTFAGIEVIFQIRVARYYRVRSERRAAQVGM